MGKKIEEIRTFGDARAMLLQSIVDIRDGNLSVSQGMAIAATMKVVNDSVQIEINAAKLASSANANACKFGEVVQMGQRLIGS